LKLFISKLKKEFKKTRLICWKCF